MGMTMVGLRFFEETLCLWVVLGLDLFIVKEVLLSGWEVVELEAGAVESVLVGFTTDVVHSHIDRLGGSLIGLWLADIRWGWWCSIRVWLVVVQCGVDVVFGDAALNRCERLEGRGVSTAGLLDCC